MTAAAPANAAVNDTSVHKTPPALLGITLPNARVAASSPNADRRTSSEASVGDRGVLRGHSIVVAGQFALPGLAALAHREAGDHEARDRVDPRPPEHRVGDETRERRDRQPGA